MRPATGGAPESIVFRAGLFGLASNPTACSNRIIRGHTRRIEPIGIELVPSAAMDTDYPRKMTFYSPDVVRGYMLQSISMGHPGYGAKHDGEKGYAKSRF
jgi:hypothetical protein